MNVDTYLSTRRITPAITFDIARPSTDNGDRFTKG